jgi:hypothetical protein
MNCGVRGHCEHLCDVVVRLRWIKQISLSLKLCSVRKFNYGIALPIRNFRETSNLNINV